MWPAVTVFTAVPREYISSIWLTQESKFPFLLPYNENKNSSEIATFMTQTFLRQVHSPLQSELPTECDIILPLSKSLKVIQWLLTSSSSYFRPLHICKTHCTFEENVRVENVQYMCQFINIFSSLYFFSHSSKQKDRVLLLVLYVHTVSERMAMKKYPPRKPERLSSVDALMCQFVYQS